MNLNKYKWLGLISFPLIAQSQVITPRSTPAPGAASGNETAPAINFPPHIQDLIKLANGGVGDAVLLAYVNKSAAPYDHDV